MKLLDLFRRRKEIEESTFEPVEEEEIDFSEEDSDEDDTETRRQGQ